MRSRSGFRERLDLTLHHRKPVDVLEMHDWLNQDFGPLMDAMSQITVVGTQDAIIVAGRVLRACVDLMDLVLKPAPNRSNTGRYLQGERWTPAQRQAIEAAQRRLGTERLAFAALCE